LKKALQGSRLLLSCRLQSDHRAASTIALTDVVPIGSGEEEGSMNEEQQCIASGEEVETFESHGEVLMRR